MSRRLRTHLAFLTVALVVLRALDATLWAPTSATFVVGDVVFLGLLTCIVGLAGSSPRPGSRHNALAPTKSARSHQTPSRMDWPARGASSRYRS